jgi:hypothetical protein
MVYVMLLPAVTSGAALGVVFGVVVWEKVAVLRERLAARPVAAVAAPVETMRVASAVWSS